MISLHFPTGTLPAGVSRQQSAEKIALHAIALTTRFYSPASRCA
ncbi:hypothetical protein [Nostoc sp.]